ncbi:hypothetical protein RFI_05128 [Reticulomyxa filosa]|uniref:Uncharacterized protein n=1 Tax=Reticulomyxa filosa TaxID=46433 RepID=X6P351_RETFI|nr:hypothetical protein RFI_05128 [Reticulomyxa filosa]|eukprot:ETO31992.1 hypothetical protein RFI_05128 [Reticulomyxa filosa]
MFDEELTKSTSTHHCGGKENRWTNNTTVKVGAWYTEPGQRNVFDCIALFALFIHKFLKNHLDKGCEVVLCLFFLSYLNFYCCILFFVKFSFKSIISYMLANEKKNQVTLKSQEESNKFMHTYKSLVMNANENFFNVCLSNSWTFVHKLRRNSMYIHAKYNKETLIFGYYANNHSK